MLFQQAKHPPEIPCGGPCHRPFWQSLGATPWGRLWRHLATAALPRRPRQASHSEAKGFTIDSGGGPHHEVVVISRWCCRRFPPPHDDNLSTKHFHLSSTWWGCSVGCCFIVPTKSECSVYVDDELAFFCWTFIHVHKTYLGGHICASDCDFLMSIYVHTYMPLPYYIFLPGLRGNIRRLAVEAVAFGAALFDAEDCLASSCVCVCQPLCSYVALPCWQLRVANAQGGCRATLHLDVLRVRKQELKQTRAGAAHPLLIEQRTLCA